MIPKQPKKREELIAAIRSVFGTYSVFAFNVGCSCGLVSQICNGFVAPTAERAERWAKALNTTTKKIFPELV